MASLSPGKAEEPSTTYDFKVETAKDAKREGREQKETPACSIKFTTLVLAPLNTRTETPCDPGLRLFSL